MIGYDWSSVETVDEIFSASMLYVMKFRTDVGWTEEPMNRNHIYYPLITILEEFSIIHIC